MIAMARPRCFRVTKADNVATMLDDGEVGPVELIGDERSSLALREPIKLGHKIAIADIAADQAIIKFGIVIGRASMRIYAGDWVHLHNCSSNFDQRSQTLDVHTGAVTDTKYE
jgi:hypothetical protein